MARSLKKEGISPEFVRDSEHAKRELFFSLAREIKMNFAIRGQQIQVDIAQLFELAKQTNVPWKALFPYHLSPFWPYFPFSSILNPQICYFLIVFTYFCRLFVVGVGLVAEESNEGDPRHRSTADDLQRRANAQKVINRPCTMIKTH